MKDRRTKLLSAMEAQAKKEFSENALVYQNLNERVQASKRLMDSLTTQADHYKNYEGYQTARTIRSQSVTVQILLAEVDTCAKNIKWLELELNEHQQKLAKTQNKLCKINEKRDELKKK